MARGSLIASSLPILLVIFLLIPHTAQLQSSQSQTLLQIQKLLNYPTFLSHWNGTTDFCNTDPEPSLTVVCYEDGITQLHIIGEEGSRLLPRNFSIDSLFTTLARLPSLKVLSLVSLGLWGPLPAKIGRLSSLEIVNMSSNFLYGAVPEEISLLKDLQTLILDYNIISGSVPEGLSALPSLAVLSLKNNSFSGPLPDALSNMENLRVLELSRNRLTGEVPDLSSLRNLQVLNLEDNLLGPQFPRLGNKVVTLVLKKNRFSSGIPPEVVSFFQLQRLDISSNRFVGPFPLPLLSLPSIRYLNIEGNRLTGMLFENTSCNPELGFVDLTSNLLSGELPKCLVSDSEGRVARYAGNCLATQTQSQHPRPFCRNEALAVGIVHRKQKKGATEKAVIASSVVGGVAAGLVLAGILTWLILRRKGMRRVIRRPPRNFIAEKASTEFSLKLVSDTRYISQAMRLGALGLPPYRMFSLEELEEATNNFETSTFMGESSHGQMYRGRLHDGSLVAIRCLKLKKRHTAQDFMQHIELISKLRHCHLVSALGHCFEYYLDDSSVSRLFLVFEYVPNGTLRRNICERTDAERLTWTQRITAAIGIVKGIQFLHASIVPGIFANNVNTTNVLLGQNLVAKISCYSLPVLTEVGAETYLNSPKQSKASRRAKQDDKDDVYDFGVILLEMIVGRPITSQSEVNTMKNLLQASIASEEAARRSVVDPIVTQTSADESLKTIMEICTRCLSREPADRPSIEDVLWNLHFAAQVQEAWRGDSQSSEDSPISPSQPSQMQIVIQ